MVARPMRAQRARDRESPRLRRAFGPGPHAAATEKRGAYPASPRGRRLSGNAQARVSPAGLTERA
ncbi:hypothetical protein BVI2075_180019 [Burkholderia vietnamiensis]|nr:hypothetical protein BVI2075_180019 [Burkholderia vietnamiensis]CAG9210181.1 hypothetical protein BVI1335_2100002 [Burkholderia vietnamiensis]